MGKGALNRSSATPRGAPLRNPTRFVRAVEATYGSGNQSSYPKAVRVAMPAGIVPLLERAETEEMYEYAAALPSEPTHVIALSHLLHTGRKDLAEGHRPFRSLPTRLVRLAVEHTDLYARHTVMMARPSAGAAFPAIARRFDAVVEWSCTGTLDHGTPLTAHVSAPNRKTPTAHGFAVPHPRGKALAPAGTGGHGSADVRGGTRHVLREAM